MATGNARGNLTHGGAIANVDPAAGAAPTKEEYDELAEKFNTLLKACRSANIIS